MKKIILATLAASLVATPVLAAPMQHDRNDHRQPPRHATWKPAPRPAPMQYRSWHRGDRFDYRYARNYGQIDYRHYRGLKAPPRGYHYVRSGNDAVLVGITTGIVAAVIANAIH